MAIVRLVLKIDKKIRGKDFKARTLLLDGECRSGAKPSDVEKAIQLGELRVDLSVESLKAEPKKAG